MKIISWILIYVLLLEFVFCPLIQAQERQLTTKRIALVDFRNFSGDVKLDHFRKSIPDQIQTVLAETGKLRLVEKGRLDEALTKLKLDMGIIIDDQIAVQLGRVLQTNAVITGSFEKEGTILQITARVIEVSTNEVITGVIERCQIGKDVFITIDKVANLLINQLERHQWGETDSRPRYTRTERSVLMWAGFQNLTGDWKLDRYKNAIPDQILTVLAGTGKLRLAERRQSEQASKKFKLGPDGVVDDQDVIQLGEALMTHAIITGSFHEEGGMFQIAARVIEVKNNEVITGVVERCTFGNNVFFAVDKVADALIDKIEQHNWSEIIFQPETDIFKKREKKGSKTLLWVGLGVAVVAGGVITALKLGKKEEGTISVEIPVRQ